MKLPSLLRGYAAPRTAFTPVQGEAGSDLDSWLGDLVGGGPDVNPALSGQAKFIVYDEMRKTDAAIKSTLSVPKLAVRSAVWGLNPRYDNDPDALRIRDMVAENLGLDGHDGWLDISWDETLQQALTMLEFGVCIEELVWGDLRDWTDADGVMWPVIPLARLAPRSPKTIQQVKRNKGQIIEIVQNVPGAQPIPGDKITHLIYEREGDRWDGISFMRPMWGAWLLKKNLMIGAGIAYDRYSLGVPVVWHPDNQQAEETAKSIGRNLRAHERANVHFPSKGRLASGHPDSAWALEVLNAAQTIADPVPLIKLCSEEIASAGLQQAMRQGMGQHGARASATAQMDPLFMAIEALAENVRLQRSRQVIRRIVEVNFGPEAAEKLTPKLTVSKIQAKNAEVMAQSIALLDSAGIHFTDLGAQNDIREMLGFDVLDSVALAAAGVNPTQLHAVLAGAGLDSTQLAAVVKQLPAGFGLAPNQLPTEGNDLLGG